MRRDTLVMDQFGMAFSPGLLVLERGQTVRFQNSEDVVHNVQVRWLDRDSTLFNAGTAQGSPFHFTFEETGSYDVYCDIHPGMTAMLLVHDAAMVVTAARDGSFRLEDIPPGSYSVEVWSADPRLRGRRSVVVGVGRTELDLRDR